MAKGPLSLLVLIWFYISFPIVLWDASYIILRPLTMKGGDLEALWSPYQTYIQVEGRYGDMADGFGIAQSWVNLFELVIGVFALIQHFRGRRSAVLYAFASQFLCFGKTVCYFLTEICSGYEYTGHNLAKGDYFSFWILFVLPSSFWLVFPFLVSWSTGKQIITALNSTSSAPKSSGKSSGSQGRKKKAQ